MKTSISDQKGFTLIEIIVTLVLVGITAVLAGMWIISVADGYVFAKMNMNNLQKSQMAMTRLEKEFIGIKTVDTSGANTNATKISYTRTDRALGDVSGVVSWAGSGNPLVLNSGGTNYTLADDVINFSLSYCNDNLGAPSCSSSWSQNSRLIAITLNFKGPENTQITYIRRIAPRNL